MAPSKLAGAPNCNEQLPVGDPDEMYLFHQFMPIVKEEAGATLQLAIPLEIAYPKLVAWVRARSLPGEVERLAALKKGTTPFVPKWKNAAVGPEPATKDVYISAPSKVLARGQFEHSGKK